MFQGFLFRGTIGFYSRVLFKGLGFRGLSSARFMGRSNQGYKAINKVSMLITTHNPDKVLITRLTKSHGPPSGA